MIKNLFLRFYNKLFYIKLKKKNYINNYYYCLIFKIVSNIKSACTIRTC